MIIIIYTCYSYNVVSVLSNVSIGYDRKLVIATVTVPSEMTDGGPEAGGPYSICCRLRYCKHLSHLP